MDGRDESPATGLPEDFEEALASEDPTTRRAAIDRFGALARTDVETAAESVDPVARRLTDESAVVARGAAEAMAPVARERPETLRTHLETLVELLGADAIDISLAGAKLLSPVAVDYPDDVGEHVDRVVEILVDDEVAAPETTVPESVDRAESRQMIQAVQRETVERRQFVRRTAANVVVAVVESEPSHLGNPQRLQWLLDDADPGVAGPAVDALGLVGNADPEAVAPTVSALRDCLDHDLEPMRARAIRALGHLGVESAVPDLRAVAEEADDEDVATLAAETAAFLADD